MTLSSPLSGLEILAKSRKAVVDLNNRHLMKRPHYAGHLYQAMLVYAVWAFWLDD